jgi:hypothetical protein
MGKYDYFVKLMNDYDKAEKEELKFEEGTNGEQEQTVPQQER